MAEYIFELTDALYDEETGDAVWKPTVKGELVRCKDCKHRIKISIDIIPNVFAWGCNYMDAAMGDNDFCSKGERRPMDECTRCCCNCRHDIRTWDDDAHCTNHCEIDGHYIGYVESFEGWCRHWAKERKMDGGKVEGAEKE